MRLRRTLFLRPSRSQGARTNAARRSRPSRSESNTRGAAVKKQTKVIPRSHVFVGPEEAVTTFEVEHPATLGNRSGGRAPRDATIIKDCPSRYALENCESLQMGTLSYYRKQGDSLIWDLGEGVIAGDERSERRRDDPTDLNAYKQTDTELYASHPLGRASGSRIIKRLDVNENSKETLLLGDNCLIWCASLEPQNATQRSLWRKSLKHDYDHTTFLGKPAPFARALALMASSQRDILGSYLDLRHPVTGHVEQCSNLAVFYGTVVYLDNPRDYILEPDDDLELIFRRVFTKTTEHRHQREYRFAILSRQSLDCETVHLQVPASLRQALNPGSGSRGRGLHLPEGAPAFCMPSPRLLQCFERRPTQRSADYRHALSRQRRERPRKR